MRGKLNVQNNVFKQAETMRLAGNADDVVIWGFGGKIQKDKVGVFAIGSGWSGE